MITSTAANIAGLIIGHPLETIKVRTQNSNNNIQYHLI